MIFLGMGYDKTLEFISVYAIEKGLTVDNMFVFLYFCSYSLQGSRIRSSWLGFLVPLVWE